MNVVNRSVFIVTPKQPYITWANTVDDAEPKLDITSPHHEPPVYLVDEILDESDLQRLIRRYYRQIFEHELAGWHQDRAVWPERRDFRTFQAWFEVKISTLVMDLGRGHITDQDLPI